MSFMVCGTTSHLYLANPSAVLKVGPIDMTNDVHTTFQCLGIIFSFITNYPSFPLMGRIKLGHNSSSNPTIPNSFSQLAIPYSIAQLEPLFDKDSITRSCSYVFSAIESANRVICKSVWLLDLLVNHEFEIIRKLKQNGLTWVTTRIYGS